MPISLLLPISYYPSFSFSTTTLPTIGKAVASVLRCPVETRNRAVYIQDTATTLQALLAKAKTVAGAQGWKEEVVAVDDVLAKVREELGKELGKEEPDREKFVYGFIKASIWGEGYGAHFPEVDNELLGLGQMDEWEVEALVRRYV